MAGKLSEKLVENSTFSGNHVPKLTKIIYPWSGIFRDACYALVGSFLMQYVLISGVLSTDPDEYLHQYSLLTTLMMIAIIWDGINDPIMGFIVEKVHFKLGKFRPWILIGALGNTLAVILMFTVRPHGWGFVGTCIAFYLLWDTFFTMNDVGYWSMLPSLTSDSKERASLTTQTTVATSIGAFLMNICAVLLPTAFQSKGIGAAPVYAWLAVAASVLFLVSQSLVFFLCKEKKRDPKQEEVSEKTKFLDLFKIIGKNSQLRATVLSLFLYYLFAMLLTGIGQNYFYIVFGYGSNTGGMVYTVLTVFYIIGTVIAQVFYPALAKRFPKKKIIGIALIVCALMYLVFLLCGFPLFGDNPLAYNKPDEKNMFWIFGGTMWIYYLSATVFFGAQGIIYLCLLVMMQDSIDYQEWKFGERKESVAFAWRPLTVKIGSALQRGIILAAYAVSGVSVTINGISTAEGLNNSGWYREHPNGGTVDGVTHAGSLSSDTSLLISNVDKHQQLSVLGLIIIGFIVVCLLAMSLILKFGYKIDEKKEEEILSDLKLRHEEDAKAMKAASSKTPDGKKA